MVRKSQLENSVSIGLEQLLSIFSNLSQDTYCNIYLKISEGCFFPLE